MEPHKQKREQFIQMQEGISGRKIHKVQDIEEFPIGIPDYRPFIKEKFDAEQIKSLIEHLKELEKYYQFASYQIQHHDRSIATLPKQILSRFPQINNRVKTMVEKAKYNVSFLDEILMPYKPLVLQSMLDNQQDESQHHCHHNYSIPNMFYHIVKEWSDRPQIGYIKRIVQYMQKYSSLGEKVQSKKSKVLVVGSGMGRILHQIKQKYHNAQVQGHQSDTQKYLCGQYFLNRCSRSLTIYPYIHNFTNFLNEKDPYRPINVPSIIDSHTYFYPLTLGDFTNLYKGHEECWDIIITSFNNENITNILHYIRLIYRMLKEGGLWIDCSTSNFNQNIIRMTYGEYEAILDKSQFELLQKSKEQQSFYGDVKSLMNERRVNYYRVMRK